MGETYSLAPANSHTELLSNMNSELRKSMWGSLKNVILENIVQNFDFLLMLFWGGTFISLISQCFYLVGLDLSMYTRLTSSS